MKIAVITHHFPPNYNAGGEQYAYRLCKYLISHGHNVEVVTVESNKEGTLQPESKFEKYEEIPVNRLFFNLQDPTNQFELTYRNPYIGKWVKDFLQRTQPDLVHFNSGYLFGGVAIEEAKGLKIPTVLTLHEYWFLCPTGTLYRTNGQVCEEMCPSARCAWVQLQEKRRYRIPNELSRHRLEKTIVSLSKWTNFQKMIGINSMIVSIEDRRDYLKRILQDIDVVLSPSRFLIQKFQDFGFNTSNIRYQPFGLDLKLPEPDHSQVSSSKRVLRIGYLGQFASHKGIHVLIKAFQNLRYPDGMCKLFLFGKYSPDSPYGKQLSDLIKKPDDIIFRGSYDNTKVGQILSQLDVIVVPSIWYENRPTVIVEALSADRPVIASKIGGIVELVNDEINGLLFEPGSDNELTEKLQRLLDEPNLLLRLKAGIDPVYTIEEEMSAIISVYQSLIGQR
ncbi:MAG TPA: glycosyltransferase family 4 protein [Anaerolineaceae bacterium]|nr:glycosyltransferase family 4 protein [Anaerolineaceae bacterium]